MNNIHDPNRLFFGDRREILVEPGRPAPTADFVPSEKTLEAIQVAKEKIAEARQEATLLPDEISQEQ